MQIPPRSVWATLVFSPLVLGVAGAEPAVRLPKGLAPPSAIRLPPEIQMEIRTARLPDPPVIIYGSLGWEAAFRSVIANDRAPAGFAVSNCETDPDVDDDGWDSLHCPGGRDCDDEDWRRNGGRDELTDAAGRDEDCDYTTVGALDRDADGYTDYDEFQVVRSIYSHHPIAILLGGDCNDYVPEMNPRSPEVPGDSIDNNCNGAIDEPPPDEARTRYRKPPV